MKVLDINGLARFWSNSKKYIDAKFIVISKTDYGNMESHDPNTFYFILK